MSFSFVVFNCWGWEVIACFVVIDGIVDQDCFHFIFIISVFLYYIYRWELNETCLNKKRWNGINANLYHLQKKIIIHWIKVFRFSSHVSMSVLPNLLHRLLFVLLVFVSSIKLPPWSLSHYSWIYNYLYNQCLSPQKLWVWIPLSNLRRVCGFHMVLRFPSQIKLTATI